MGVSGYTTFVKETRKKVKDEHPEMSFQEISSEVGRLWKELPQEEKQKYNDMAAKYNEEHKNDPKPEKKKKEKKEKKEKKAKSTAKEHEEEEE